MAGLRLVAMKGPPGSGKSTLARALGRRLGWPLIGLETDSSRGSA